VLGSSSDNRQTASQSHSAFTVPAAISRTELFALHRRIVTDLAMLPADSPERLTALANLRCIRQVLARPNAAPR
jgi:hypothetical protein